MARDRDAILADLDTVADGLEAATAERTDLYQRRLELFQEARALVPPVTQRDLASHARVSEPAVIQVLRSAREKAEAAP